MYRIWYITLFAFITSSDSISLIRVHRGYHVSLDPLQKLEVPDFKNCSA
jgi:hypothetical protein